MPDGDPPEGAVLADQSKLGHINTYGDLPRYYSDYAFDCRDCGIHQIWTARQQKIYYEEHGGHISAVAIRCRACRSARRNPNSDRNT